MSGPSVNASSPDQERIGRVRCALITVAAALDDQAQIVVASEIYRGDHVGGFFHRDCVGARSGGPRIDLSGNLRTAGLVADVEGVAEILDYFGATRIVATGNAGCEH